MPCARSTPARRASKRQSHEGSRTLCDTRRAILPGSQNPRPSEHPSSCRLIIRPALGLQCRARCAGSTRKAHEFACNRVNRQHAMRQTRACDCAGHAPDRTCLLLAITRPPAAQPFGCRQGRPYPYLSARRLKRLGQKPLPPAKDHINRACMVLRLPPRKMQLRMPASRRGCTKLQMPISARKGSVPGIAVSPPAASRTLSRQCALSRSASGPVKISGMCCATSTGSGKSAGRPASRISRATGPPVDTPITTIDGAGDMRGRGRLRHGRSVARRTRRGERMNFRHQLAGKRADRGAVSACCAGLAT